MLVTIRTKPCMQCGNSSELTVPAEGLAEWTAGAFVQHAFPTLSADEREMLISGTHPTCWDQMFPPDQD